jgi:hypothetical protein
LAPRPARSDVFVASGRAALQWPFGGVSRFTAGGAVDSVVASRLNQQILRVAELLPAAVNHKYGFSCECGCGELAP